jgi:hypothetical protein
MLLPTSQINGEAPFVTREIWLTTRLGRRQL